jgi:hypothetical protein
VLFWIALGVVVVGVVVLLVVLGSVFGTLRRFGVVAQSVQRRLLDGQQRLQPKLDKLQHDLEALQGPAAVAQERVAALQAARGASDNS